MKIECTDIYINRYVFTILITSKVFEKKIFQEKLSPKLEILS